MFSCQLKIIFDRQAAPPSIIRYKYSFRININKTLERGDFRAIFQYLNFKSKILGQCGKPFMLKNNVEMCALAVAKQAQRTHKKAVSVRVEKIRNSEQLYDRNQSSSSKEGNLTFMIPNLNKNFRKLQISMNVTFLVYKTIG